MIKFTGVIPAKDGISEYKDLLINVDFSARSKYSPAIGIAQLGEFTEATEKAPASFNPTARLGVYKYDGKNPSFEAVQATVLAGLQSDYPNVTFEIV